jgi:flagellin-like protein
MKNKNGLSTVVATVIMIAMVIAAIAIVWGVVSNLVADELEGADACVNIFDKVEINGAYTCYDLTTPGDFKFQFSLSIGDIEVDEILFAISDEGSTKSFSIDNDAKIISGITNHPSGDSSIVLPEKNAGLTYIYNLSASGFSSGPDSLEVAPTINEKQCGSSDSLTDIPNCASLI